MPQLDLASYLTQLLWLFFFFMTLYFMAIKYILPTIANALKVRHKNLKFNTTKVLALTYEKNIVTSVYKHFLEKSVLISKNLIHRLQREGSIAFKMHLIIFNKYLYLNLNKHYLKHIIYWITTPILINSLLTKFDKNSD